MKKNIITIVISVVALCLIGFGIYFILNKNNNPENTENKPLVDCEYTGELKLGATYEKDKYLYTYIELDDNGIKVNGWNVKYTDPYNKEATKAPNCGTIGGEPLISTKSMYSFVEAKSIDITDLNTKNVIDMTGMFEYEKAKEIIGLLNLDTSNVTNMNGMFFRSSVEKLNLTNFNTGKVLNMDSMFYGAEALTIDVSSFNTTNVLNMNEMFKNVEVKELNLSSFDISNTLEMEDMFAGCNATVYIGTKQTPSLWEMKTGHILNQ